MQGGDNAATDQASDSETESGKEVRGRGRLKNSATHQAGSIDDAAHTRALGVLTGAAGTAALTSHKEVQRDALPHAEVLAPSAAAIVPAGSWPCTCGNVGT
jgi:hypothetical protein